MAKKPAAPKKHALDIFATIRAIDNHDMGYYDRLTPEEQKGYFAPVVMRWVSHNSKPLDDWAIMVVNERANMHHFALHEYTDLQYKLVASTGMGMPRSPQWIKGAAKVSHTALHTFLLKYWPDANALELEVVLKTLREGNNLKDFLDGTGLPAEEIKRVRKLFDA